MRLREYYLDKNDQEVEDAYDRTEDSMVTRIWKEEEARSRNKIWMPPMGRDPALDMYISLVKEDILKGISKCQTSNVSKGEEGAMRILLNE